MKLLQEIYNKIQTYRKLIKENIPGHPKFHFFQKEALEELPGFNFS